MISACANHLFLRRNKRLIDAARLRISKFQKDDFDRFEVNFFYRRTFLFRNFISFADERDECCLKTAYSLNVVRKQLCAKIIPFDCQKRNL